MRALRFLRRRADAWRVARLLALLVALLCLTAAPAAAGPPLVTMHGLVLLERYGGTPAGQFLVTPDGHVIDLFVPPESVQSLPPIGSVVDVRAYDNRFADEIYPVLVLEGPGTYLKKRGSVSRLVVHGKVGRISEGAKLVNGKYVVDGTSFVDFVRPLWRLVGGKPVIDGEHEADAFALTPALRKKVTPWVWDYKLRPGDRATWSFSLKLHTHPGTALRPGWELVDVTPDP